jgi:hypothetical protein
MAKDWYNVELVSKADLKPLLDKFHYLSNISKGFKSKFNVGLVFSPPNGEKALVGACIFTGFPVPELATGCFGLARNDQEGLWELSRLVLHPTHQQIEHNLASWFVSRSIRLIRKEEKVRAILSYADDDFHSGIVYAATNFTYYGTSASKCDFWKRLEDGTFQKQSRGRTKGVNGEWRPRSLKHRFLKVFDPSLTCKWQTQDWKPNRSNDNERVSCANTIS